MPATRGRCQCCGTFGPRGRERDFLCGECVNPVEIRSFCGNCKRRKKIMAWEDASQIAPQFKDFLRPGLAIRLVCCEQCVDPAVAKKSKHKVYSPKLDDSLMN